MSVTIANVYTSCDRDAARLDTYAPTLRKGVIVSLVDGQSNAQGGHGDNSAPITQTADTAFATDADNTNLTLRVLTVNASGTGPDRIGSVSSIYGFAAELWDTYGVRTVNTMSAWQGTALIEDTPNGLDPAFRWSVDDDYVALSLQRSPATLGPQVRNRIVPHQNECMRLRPDLKALLKVAHWSQGEAEAPHLLSGVVTKAEYTAGLQAHWNWRKSEGFQVMVVHEHGRKGLDAENIASNEPMDVLVREAQADFVNANSDVIWGSQAAKETGTLVVDSDGAWVSGFDYFTDDGGVHWTGPAQNAIGRYAAKQVAAYASIAAI